MQFRSLVGSQECEPLCEGRLSPAHHSRRAGRGEPGGNGHKGLRVVSIRSGAGRKPHAASALDAKRVQRQAFAGLLCSKQFYHFVVETWLKGDPGQPTPPASRLKGRNSNWIHLYNEDVISMPD